MAIYRWSVEDLELGVNPIGDGWTLVEGSVPTVSAVEIDEDSPTGTRSWRVRASTSETRLMLLDAVASTTDDVELLVLMKRATSGQDTIMGFPRLDASGSPYVGMGLSNNTTQWRWQTQSGHTGSDHGLVSDNVWLWHRIKAVSTTTTYIKTWVPGNAEPPEWGWTRTATIPAAGQVGWGGYFNSGRDFYLAYLSVGTGVDAAPLPTEATEKNLGLRITDIKEPNIANELVTGVTNARVKVWIGTNDSDWEDDIASNQVIENGVLEVTVSNQEFALHDTVTMEVMWTVGTERKLFITQTNVMDLEGEE